MIVAATTTRSSRRSGSPDSTASSRSSRRSTTRSTATPSARGARRRRHGEHRLPGSQDAQHDFSRARRARLLADVGRRLRREPDDVALILPFEEVVDALGRVGQRDRGLQVVPLDAIVGTVDRAADFDRGFRPTSPRLRARWERIAAAQRRGESLPPVSLYKVGDLYFVRDGHHRVSVAKSLGRDDIDAYVDRGQDAAQARRTTCASPTCRSRTTSGCSASACRSTAEQRARIQLSDPWDFGGLAETVEAWGFRAMQERGHFMDRHEVAQRWFERGVRAGRRDARARAG